MPTLFDDEDAEAAAVAVPPPAAAGGGGRGGAARRVVSAAESLGTEKPAPDDADAVTADKLHSVKRVCVKSPDGKLSLWYNTSTLVRIAQTKGKWLQPPHFREDMKPELIKKIEELEGRGPISVNIPLMRDRVDDDDVEHRGYAQMQLENHFLLSKREIYVCPLCYEAAARRLDQMAASRFEDKRRALDELRLAMAIDESEFAQGSREINRQEKRATLRRCPIEVLSSLDEDTELPYVAFANARLWRTHYRGVHGSSYDTPGDNTVRSLVNAYLVKHNSRHLQNGNFHKQHSTTQRYWAADARYNAMRYNMMREYLEEQEDRDDIRSRCAMEVEVQYESPANADAAAFIADDDEDSGGDEEGVRRAAGARVRRNDEVAEAIVEAAARERVNNSGSSVIAKYERLAELERNAKRERAAATARAAEPRRRSRHRPERAATQSTDVTHATTSSGDSDDDETDADSDGDDYDDDDAATAATDDEESGDDDDPAGSDDAASSEASSSSSSSSLVGVDAGGATPAAPPVHPFFASAQGGSSSSKRKQRQRGRRGRHDSPVVSRLTAYEQRRLADLERQEAAADENRAMDDFVVHRHDGMQQRELVMSPGGKLSFRRIDDVANIATVTDDQNSVDADDGEEDDGSGFHRHLQAPDDRALAAVAAREQRARLRLAVAEHLGFNEAEDARAAAPSRSQQRSGSTAANRQRRTTDDEGRRTAATPPPPPLLLVDDDDDDDDNDDEDGDDAAAAQHQQRHDAGPPQSVSARPPTLLVDDDE